MVDQLEVKQEVEILEVATGFEMRNKYKVFNALGQQVYYAREDTDLFTRQWGTLRPFDMNITDRQGQEAIHLSRLCKCQGCCCFCCLQEMEVCSPPGTLIGKIEQQWSCFPKFVIKDQVGQ